MSKLMEELGGRNGTAAKQPSPIFLPKLDIKVLRVTIEGDEGSPLVCHRFGQKQKLKLIDKHTGQPTIGRKIRNPVEEFVDSLYVLRPGKLKGDLTLKERDEENHPKVWIEGGQFAFPANAIVSAMVCACTSLGKAITKVQARQCFRIMGNKIVLEGGRPEMREDNVNVGGMSRSADMRYRAQFKTWRAKIIIRYNVCVMSAEQVVSLLNTAGFAVGIGEWRPEKEGNWGMFHVL